jgi:FAD dependent oxidoreductase
MLDEMGAKSSRRHCVRVLLKLCDVQVHLAQPPRPATRAALEPCRARCRVVEGGAGERGDDEVWRCPCPQHAHLAAHQDQLAGAYRQGGQLGDGVGYMATGSLLLSDDREGAAALERRAVQLARVGLRTEWLTPKQCMALEPLLHVPAEGAGLRVTSDFQIDAQGACQWLLAQCSELGRQRDRFHIEFDCKAQKLLMGCCGAMTAIKTSRGCFRGMCVRSRSLALLMQITRLHALPSQLLATSGAYVAAPARRAVAEVRAVCRRGAVVALGSASGALIASSFSDSMYASLLSRRWGVLLSAAYPGGAAPLRHGTMDASYARHYARAAAGTCAQAGPDITFTACTSADGRLLLGAHHGHAGTRRPHQSAAGCDAALW